MNAGDKLIIKDGASNPKLLEKVKICQLSARVVVSEY